MKDYIELLIAFVLGFFMKHLLGTVCQSRLIEGDWQPGDTLPPLAYDNNKYSFEDGEECGHNFHCNSGQCGFTNMPGRQPATYGLGRCYS